MSLIYHIGALPIDWHPQHFVSNQLFIHPLYRTSVVSKERANNSSTHLKSSQQERKQIDFFFAVALSNILLIPLPT